MMFFYCYPVIRIFGYPDRVRSQFNRIIGVLLYVYYNKRVNIYFNNLYTVISLSGNLFYNSAHAFIGKQRVTLQRWKLTVMTLLELLRIESVTYFILSSICFPLWGRGFRSPCKPYYPHNGQQ